MLATYAFIRWHQQVEKYGSLHIQHVFSSLQKLHEQKEQAI